MMYIHAYKILCTYRLLPFWAIGLGLWFGALPIGHREYVCTDVVFLTLGSVYIQTREDGRTTRLQGNRATCMPAGGGGAAGALSVCVVHASREC